MKFIRHKDAAGRMPERGKRKGSLRGIPGLALALGLALAAGGTGTRTYAWNLDPPGIEEDGELVTFPSTSGKENGTETEKGNDWTSGLEGGTTVAILSDEPSTISATNEREDMRDLLTGLVITDKDGKVIPNEDGILYVGEDYNIELEFTEGGPLGLQFDAESGVLTYQLPGGFKAKPQGPIALTVRINDVDVNVGEFSIDETGKITLKLSEAGKKAIGTADNVHLKFNMEATAQAQEGGGDGSVDFGGTGKDFTFKVLDQVRVDVDKEGKYTEDAAKEEGKMAPGGTLEYTVKTTVKHGELHNTVVTDVLTPPNTDAFEMKMATDVTVKVKRKNPGSDEYEEFTLEDGDYELVQEDDPENSGKKTFRVVLKKDGKYDPLQEGDELDVTYKYDVKYVQGSVGQFWGNVLNTVTVTGTGKVPQTDQDSPKSEVDIHEERGSNVEIRATPPGHGIVCKDQDYSEANKTLHYTLYTVVPKTEGDEEWNPLFIYDDMYVEYKGERWYLPHGPSRVKNLTVKAVDIDGGWFDNWSESASDPDKIKKLQELKEKAEETEPLDGYNFNDFENGTKTPTGYISGIAGITKNYVYRYSGHMLHIIFGAEANELNYSKEGEWGRWKYGTDRLIITEYDLDMNGDDEIELVSGSDYKTTMKMSPGDILLTGIMNNVYLRYSGYYPGYAVYFNNAEAMNKTGSPDKDANTITFTVTMNTTDTTVNKYFQEVTADWMAQNADDKYHWGDMPAAYNDSMQAVFYDVLPDGWEYVEGSLTATAYDLWHQASYPYDKNGQLKGSHDLVTKAEGKQVIEAPLMFFYDNENTDRPNLFNWFGDSLTSLTFTYTLKATDEWLKNNEASYEESILIHNYAEIKDKNTTHWDAETDVPYLPARLTKQAEQEGKTNLLKFTLHVNQKGVMFAQKNPSGEEMPAQSYLIVTDESTNLQIQTSSIVITDAEGKTLTKSGKEYSRDDLLRMGKWPEDQWGMLSPQEEGQFSLIVPNGKALTVTYNALIPEKGPNVKVSNKAGIEGIETSETGYNGTLEVNTIYGIGEGGTYELTIQKVDKNDSNKKLEGAKFKFYIVTGNDSALTGNTSVKIGETEYSCYTQDDWTVTTGGEDGSFKITKDMSWKLGPDNYYILEETEAPDGYEKLAPVIFYYGLKKEDMDTENYPGVKFAMVGGEDPLTIADPPTPYELPETGGFGTAYLYLMGSAFVLMGGAFLLYNRRLAHRRTGR